VRLLFSVSAVSVWNLSVFGVWNPASLAISIQFRVFFLHSVVRDTEPVLNVSLLRILKKCSKHDQFSFS
jgi:hypothetical protein